MTFPQPSNKIMPGDDERSAKKSAVRIREYAMISRRALLAAGAACGTAFVTSARAQGFPEHPIRVIVPFAAGGPVDVMARLVAQPFGGIVGQPVVVENRGGASGGIGSKVVASAEPDGYTLLCGNISSLVIQPITTNSRDFDLFKSFVPVARLSQNVEVLAVAPDFPANTVRELVAYAKAHPGQLNYGSGGVGNISQLAAELFRLRTGIDIVHVPFKGAAEVFTAILGGQVQMYFGDIGGMLPLIREKRLKALALSGATRARELPDLPTMIESGVPDYQVSTFIGVMAPAGTPTAVVTRLNRAINRSLGTPEVTAVAAKLNADLTTLSPEDFGAFLYKEYDKWSDVVRGAGIKIE
jgi:tripartite-type tricarboxylate transporter receptor subunit TctC